MSLDHLQSQSKSVSDQHVETDWEHSYRGETQVRQTDTNISLCWHLYIMNYMRRWIERCWTLLAIAFAGFSSALSLVASILTIILSLYISQRFFAFALALAGVCTPWSRRGNCSQPIGGA